MKIKNRQEFLVALTIGAVGLFVAVNFIFTPLQGIWTARQKEIRDLRTRVKDGNQMIRRAADLQAHWSQMQSNALPANMSAAEQQFLSAMETWSRNSGAEVTSIMPQWKIDSTNYMSLACRVETEGDLSSLGKFLYEIEKGPLMARVDSVELSSHDANGQQMTLGVEINGLALLQNDKK